MQIFWILTLLLLSTIWKRALSIPLIVPQELPSVLSLIYSNIPPIKKGTDSRVGFGFRLGEHADFQVLYEIGPQLNTKKIGVASSTDRRRYVQKVQKKPTKSTWLQQWARDEAARQNEVYKPKKSAPSIPDGPKMPMHVVNHLQQLYGKPTADIGTEPAEKQTEYLTEKRKKNVDKITEDLANIEFD